MDYSDSSAPDSESDSSSEEEEEEEEQTNKLQHLKKEVISIIWKKMAYNYTHIQFTFICNLQVIIVLSPPR